MRVAAIVLITGGAASVASAQASFQGLGWLPNAGNFRGAYVYGLSQDGTTVVGTTDDASGTSRPFRWRSASGMVDLGHVPGGSGDGYALGVSADGGTVVGFDTLPSGERMPFIWADGS